jgi:hypothetical protein
MEKEQRGRSGIFIKYGTNNGKGGTGAFTVIVTYPYSVDPDTDPDPAFQVNPDLDPGF